MPKVDLCFQLRGDLIPADHAYLLYSALSRRVPVLHPPENRVQGRPGGDGELWSEVGIQQINAVPAGDRQLRLHPNSRLRIRIERERIDCLLPLAGVELALGDQPVRVGPAEVVSLRPLTRLSSRMVVIKGFMEPVPFLDAAVRQLRSMEVQASAGIPWRRGREGEPVEAPGKSPLVRRTIQVAGKTIVGYALEVSELTAEESIRLQESGIGGRRRFGCGIFIAPDR